MGFKTQSGTVSTSESPNSTGGIEYNETTAQFVMNLSNELKKLEDRIATLESEKNSNDKDFNKTIKSINRLSSASFWVIVFMPIVLIAAAVVVFWVTKPETMLIKVVYVVLGLIGFSALWNSFKLPEKIKNIENEIAEIKKK